MKLLTPFFALIFVFGSCKKDNNENAIEFTSDAPDEFETTMIVVYDEDENLTTVRASFFAPYSNVVNVSVILPENSYVKYNGAELTGEYRNMLEIEGHQDVLIEFLDNDQELYSNSIDVADTAYFKDLPEIVSPDEDLLISFGGPPLDNDETWQFTFPGISYGDYSEGEVHAVTTDSTVLIDKSNLQPDQSYILTLTRMKKLKYPNLPKGGGTVAHRYVVTKKTIFTE